MPEGYQTPIEARCATAAAAPCWAALLLERSWADPRICLASRSDGLEGMRRQPMLRRLEHLAFFEPDVRFEKLPEVLDQGPAGSLGLSQRAKSAVILANSAGKRGLTNGFERRQEVFFLDLEVQLEMA